MISSIIAQHRWCVINSAGAILELHVELSSNGIGIAISLFAHLLELRMISSGANLGGPGGPVPPLSKIFCTCCFYLIQHENIIQGCLISFIII